MSKKIYPEIFGRVNFLTNLKSGAILILRAPNMPNMGKNDQKDIWGAYLGKSNMVK